MTALVSVAGMLAYASDGMWGSALALAPMALYTAALYPLARRLSPSVRAQIVLSLSVVAFVGGALTESPPTLGILAWLIIVPMLATRLLGSRAGLRWLAIALFGFIVGATLSPLELLPTFSPTHPLAFQTSRFAVITLAVFAFAKQATDHSEALLCEVKAADDAKSVFLANVSHEIRTPLNGILGLTQLLLQRTLEPEIREELELVERSGQTLVHLINDLLDLTKATRGELVLERIPFDLDQLLEDLTRMARPPGTGTPGRVACRLDAAPAGVVQGDPTRVRQVLGNLVSNALKFTDQGEVVLRARLETPDRWRFEVSDTGLGMSKETLAGLFRPFKQADASIARRFGGTGLGLALAKSLTEQMGGSLDVTSSPGSGTTFTVRLPLASSALAAASAERPVPSLAGRRVLLVDDNAINLRVAQGLLQRTGCEVVTAMSGEAALEVGASAGALDLVLMDCQLPGIDGWEATVRLHGLPGRSSLPVIALTASTSPEDTQRCSEVGMVAHVAKPLLFTELCRVLAPFARDGRDAN